ncbi:MAG: peptidylprolyl isomerase [Candidatus Magasanikbacteria bacterium]|nr:peptidylprolyl isomerase [Candidatus Magasanikbacteria bacterium]
MRHLPHQQDLAQEYSQANIITNHGDILVTLYGDLSPVTVNNFLHLAHTEFYNDTMFHRVIPQFMIQGGDPLTKDRTQPHLHGTGGPDYRFGDEFNTKKIVRGTLAMANAGPHTNGSQFFIVTAEATPHLDGVHTNFGHVVAGMDVVQKIEQTPTSFSDAPLDPVIIHRIDIIKNV